MSHLRFAKIASVIAAIYGSVTALVIVGVRGKLVVYSLAAIAAYLTHSSIRTRFEGREAESKREIRLVSIVCVCIIVVLAVGPALTIVLLGE